MVRRSDKRQVTRFTNVFMFIDDLTVLNDGAEFDF